MRAGGGRLIASKPGGRLTAVATKVWERSYGVSLQDIWSLLSATNQAYYSAACKECSCNP